MDPTIFLAGAPHKRCGHPATEGSTVCDPTYPETHKFMTKNSVLLPGHPAPNYGANLQRSCDSISPYGKPPLICGRPFKEAVAAPSLLSGLGLDCSKRLLCSRQSQRGRGAPPTSKQLPPLEARFGESRSEGVFFDDTFFVTGGGTEGDQTERAAGTGAGNSNNGTHLITNTAPCSASSSSSLPNGRPRSTPATLPSDKRHLVSLGNPAHGPETAASREHLAPLRRDVRTSDAGCLGPRRLCFRSQPIHDLVSSTLLSIDPSGVFSMYEEWSNIKNRVLSRELDEQRSDLALYEELRQEDDDSDMSEDGADVNDHKEDVFPDRPPIQGETGGNGGHGGGTRRDNQEAQSQEREQGHAPGSTVPENQEYSEDRSACVASVTGEVEEDSALGALNSGTRTSSNPPTGVDYLVGTSAKAALQEGPTAVEGGARSDFRRDSSPEATNGECGTPARRRRRRRKEPRSSSRGKRAANLDYARNLDKEPGLPPLRLLRESGEGALRLAHMALGDHHVMALLASLDHLPSLTSIDVSDNRIGSEAMQRVVLTAEERGVASLDLSSNHVDRASIDMLCAFLARPGSLSSLIVKNAGVSDLAGAAIMAAIGRNTILKTLDLSGNEIGGTSDLLATPHHEHGSTAVSAGGGGILGEEARGARAATAGRLTGGVAIATCLESNYWLTHLDLSWNKIGESNAATIGAAIEHNQGLRWLSLAGNRGGDQGAFCLGTTLGENHALTHLDVSFNGISGKGAAALAQGLRVNSTIKNIQVNGNFLGWAGGRALFRTVNFSEIPRIIGIRDCGEFAEGDLDAFDPRFPGGPFDLDLSNPGQRAVAQELLLAASYRTGCSITEVAHFELSESAAVTGRGGDRNITYIELVRPSPSAPALQPRGAATADGEGSGHHLTLDSTAFPARTWSDLRETLEDFLVRSPGDSEPWQLPPAGIMSGAVDFQPLPPCMANVCNVSGLRGIVRAMSACAETRVAAFRLFVADLFFTTHQIQWVIEQLAVSPTPFNSAELLEMMAAVAPQVYNHDRLPDLVETNLSPMGRRMLVAQLGLAYPAFTGGVSGSFVLDLRFPAHRLAAVRLAEAQNLQERERHQQNRNGQDEEGAGQGGKDPDENEDGTTSDREEPNPPNLLELWRCFRNVKYKPTRAATSTAAVDDDVLSGDGGDDGEGQDGAADAKGDEGDLFGDSAEDAAAAAAASPAAGIDVAITGLGEPMAKFFQRGLLDKPTGVLQLDFVYTLRPPEGTQPTSDLALARMLNSCGLLDPAFWYQYLRPTRYPVSIVDLVRLLRVKIRGDKRQAKLLVLLLRVKNSMFRAARAEKKWKEILNRSRRRNRGLSAFEKGAPQRSTTMASTVAQLHEPTSKATTSDAITAGPQAAAGLGSNPHKAPSSNAAAAPAEGSAVGSGEDVGARSFPMVGGNNRNPGQIADANNAAAAAGDTPTAASAAVLPGAAKTEVAATTTVSSTRTRAPGSRGTFSVSNRSFKSYPRKMNAGGESLAASAEDREAVPAADAEEVAPQQELTYTQAAVVEADNKLEGLLSVGRILRAKRDCNGPHGFPQGTPVWTEGVAGSCGGTGASGRDEGGRSGLGGGGGGGVSGSGSGRSCVLGEDTACVLGEDTAEDLGKDVLGWASRFCDNKTGVFPAADSKEGVRLGGALARHVACDGDAGLIGTRPPTLLVHGLCIRVRYRGDGRFLRVKQSFDINGSGEERPIHHEKDEDQWTAVSRQGLRGSHLRTGTKREAASALAATFASRVQQKDWASGITPLTLGTLNLTEDEGWRKTFVPTELFSSNTPGGPLALRLLVTFVEVSAQFLPDDCLGVSEFSAFDHQQREAVYEWVPSDQGPEVVKTSFEPDITRSLAQLRSRLGACWLSSAQAANVASLVPRVLGGTHHRAEAVVFLFSRVVDLHNFGQVVDMLHEKKRPHVLHRLGDLDALCPATALQAPEATTVSTPTSP